LFSVLRACKDQRLLGSAIVLKPSTLFSLHRALTQRKYRRLFSSDVKPGPKGPSQEVVTAVIDMKRRNPTWGCPRIAQQITVAFGIPINKDVVRRIHAARHQPTPDSAGPSWLATLGHAKDSLWSSYLAQFRSARRRTVVRPGVPGVREAERAYGFGQHCGHATSSER
jgi:putative transposase